MSLRKEEGSTRQAGVYGSQQKKYLNQATLVHKEGRKESFLVEGDSLSGRMLHSVEDFDFLLRSLLQREIPLENVIAIHPIGTLLAVALVLPQLRLQQVDLKYANS